jgi:hypothetical protein
MFLGQHRKGLPEFLQQDGRVDACGSDALTSVAGGYQGDSFGGNVRTRTLRAFTQGEIKTIVGKIVKG